MTVLTHACVLLATAFAAVYLLYVMLRPERF